MTKLVDGEDFSILVKNNVCYINLNSPSTLNAISLRMSTIMKDICTLQENNKSIFEKFVINQNCLLIVLQSNVDKIFSSGGNLFDLYKNSSESCQQYSSSIRTFCNLLHSISIPSVTLLSGPSFGGGVELALATDFRWSIGKSCDFYFTQTHFGIPAGWGGMLRLSELCPQLSPKKVSSIIVGKMKLNLAQLINLGLIDRNFKNKKACQNALDEWVLNITNCPKQVRNDIMKRNLINSLEELEQYDIEIFNKYFLKDDHKNKILKFMNDKK